MAFLDSLRKELAGKREPNLPKLPDLPAGPHEIYIPYSAWRAQLRFRRQLMLQVNYRKEVAKLLLAIFGIWLALVLILPIVIEPLMRLGFNAYMLNILLYVYAGIISYPLLTSPSNLQVGKEGIRLHWLSALGLISSPWISFDYIDQVTVSNFKRGWYKSRAIDIYIDKANTPAGIRTILNLIAPSLWCLSLDKDKLKLRLDIAAITHEADLPILLGALRNLLPDEKLGPELLQLEQENTGASFTKLWLDSFDAGNPQLTRGNLEAGEFLCGKRYEIVDQLGAGGQAVTYLAIDHERQDATVVLKEFVLPVRGGIEIRRRALENVEHEAKLLSTLDSDQIVKLLDCFATGQRAYLVLEHIDGASLRLLVQEGGALPEQEVVALAIGMCDVLNYLHSLSPPIIHRDFTPENLLLRKTGQLALIDFNVAEQLESKQTKTMVGKHCYVPPEQFRGKAGEQSDIYAAGCTIFWLLTGQDPEPINTSHPASLCPGVTPALDAIVARATAPDTSTRYPSARQMKDDLLNLAPQAGSAQA